VSVKPRALDVVMCVWVALSVIAVMTTGCASSNMMQTDQGKGAIAGGIGGGAIGALVSDGSPWGALIGAAGGALVGDLAGSYMDSRKQDLTKVLAPEINAGLASVQLLPGNSLEVTMTGETAFPPGSAVINAAFLPTLQKVASVVSTYGKMSVAVIGHPDATGAREEREKLADQRAEAVRVQLLGMGVRPALVSASGNPNSKYLDGRVELILTPIVRYNR
jgi:outer membrane protein OmpA-like peptidoglycan-associated protein